MALFPIFMGLGNRPSFTSRYIDERERPVVRETSANRTIRNSDVMLGMFWYIFSSFEKMHSAGG